MKNYAEIPVGNDIGKIDELVAEFESVRAAEQNIKARKSEIVHALSALLGVDETAEGTKTFNVRGREVKVSTKLNRTVDGDKLEEIVRENHAEAKASELFRYKFEINQSVWKREDDQVKNLFAPAITARPGQPSITITNTNN